MRLPLLIASWYGELFLKAVMANISRQQRRAEQRELRKFHASILEHGIDPECGVDFLPTIALLFSDILKQRKDKDRALKAAETAHRIFDLTAKNNPPSSLHDCAAGCSYCCHTFTSVSAPEAFLIADQLRTAKETALSVDKFSARAKEVVGRDIDARLDRPRLACPLLVDDKCSTYDVRPLSCRMYLSFDVEACRRSFEGGLGAIPRDRILSNAGVSIKFALFAALQSCGYNEEGYELSEAVTIALTTEDALRRWTDGEDIFAGVQVDPNLDQNMRELISRLATLVK